jgi:alanine racemase
MTTRPRNSDKNSYSRDAWLEINLNTVEENYQKIKLILQSTNASSKKVMAVLKSDAYGHGASVLGTTLEACGVDYFGVASVDEGIQLRDAGIKSEILLLSPIPSWALTRAIENNLQITISDVSQLLDLEKLYKNKKFLVPVKVQIKINTGMNRNGAKWNTEAQSLIQTVLDKQNIFNICGVYSHFACSSEDFVSQVQLERFCKTISTFDTSKLGHIHIEATSTLVPTAALQEILDKHNIQPSLARVGLALFGLGKASKLGLKPVMSLLARVNLIQKIEAEEAVGYNFTWRSNRASKIALLPLGYADGIKRGLSNRIKVIYKNNLLPQVGNISMDQLTIDATDSETELKIGDVVTLLGKNDDLEIKMSDWSEILNTIDYEVACDLRVRLTRVYVRK